jgi:hypothetical protein
VPRGLGAGQQRERGLARVGRGGLADRLGEGLAVIAGQGGLEARPRDLDAAAMRRRTQDRDGEQGEGSGRRSERHGAPDREGVAHARRDVPSGCAGQQHRRDPDASEHLGTEVDEVLDGISDEPCEPAVEVRAVGPHDGPHDH